MPARMSRLLVPTLRDAPADAELASHRLLVRAGFIRRVDQTAGFYSLLPLGQRVKARIERIIRQELDAIGGQECQLPIVQPAPLWERSGRWAVYGEEMWRLADRHGHRYCLGPTHEEVITTLVGGEVRSWRQLPQFLYQIQNKYRDEQRPRFGLLRSREFVMKDGYSFHTDEADLERCYTEVYQAYERIFRRVGLDCRPVQADPGAIGGSRTHEFMALAEAGEAEVVLCDACGYAADVERAEAGLRPPPPVRVMERVATPGARSVEEVAGTLGVAPATVAKSLFFHATHGDGRQEIVAALLPGDRVLNELQLRNACGAMALRAATPDELQVPLGSAGPIGLQGIRLFTDRQVAAGGGWVVGANAEGFHWIGASAGRDFDPGSVVSLGVARAGDACPECAAALRSCRGIEVGQVFGLGTKYSAALGATYLDSAGQEVPMVMGCYGIGVTRTLAAVVEQHHDADGIRWPAAVAPYGCALVTVGTGAEGARAVEAAQTVCRRLEAAGVDTLWDDRDERPGVKFKDADLIGLPVRVTFGRALERGLVEVKARSASEPQLLPLDAVPAAVATALEA